MEEKQKNKKTIITKETIISAVIGLIIGIVITCLVVLCINYFKNRLATINGKTILLFAGALHEALSQIPHVGSDS